MTLILKNLSECFRHNMVRYGKGCPTSAGPLVELLLDDTEVLHGCTYLIEHCIHRLRGPGRIPHNQFSMACHTTSDRMAMALIWRTKEGIGTKNTIPSNSLHCKNKILCDLSSCITRDCPGQVSHVSFIVLACSELCTSVPCMCRCPSGIIQGSSCNFLTNLWVPMKSPVTKYTIKRDPGLSKEFRRSSIDISGDPRKSVHHPMQAAEFPKTSVDLLHEFPQCPIKLSKTSRIWHSHVTATWFLIQS